MNRFLGAVLIAATALAAPACTSAVRHPPPAPTTAAWPTAPASLPSPFPAQPIRPLPAWVAKVLADSPNAHCPIDDPGDVTLLGSDGHSEADVAIVRDLVCIVAIYPMAGGAPTPMYTWGTVEDFAGGRPELIPLQTSSDGRSDQAVYVSAFPGDAGMVQVRPVGEQAFGPVHQVLIVTRGRLATLAEVRVTGGISLLPSGTPELCPASGRCRPLT